jgi:hypothetical protein
MLRIPLYIDETSDNNLRQLTPAQIDSIVDYATKQYGNDPSVTLRVVSTGGSLDAQTDTRLQAGSSASSASAFPAEGTVSDTSDITVQYQRMIEELSGPGASVPVDTNNVEYPLYWNDGVRIILEDDMGYVLHQDDDHVQQEQIDNPTLQSMSTQDMLDTFIYPAIDKLVLGSIGDEQNGTYHINTANSGVAGSTLVDATPVYIDTRADASAYAAANIPETRDQPSTVESFYLWRIDEATQTITEYPCHTNVDGTDIQEHGIPFHTDLQNLIKWCAVNDVNGYKLRYNINIGGANRGSGMTDTKLNSQTYATHQVGPDDYRAQKFPSGSPTTLGTYYLKINKA